MATGSRRVSERILVDFLVESTDGEAVLLAEVNRDEFDSDAIERMRSSLDGVNAEIPFVLLVDPDQVRLFRWDRSELMGPVFTSETPPILRVYAPDFPGPPMPGYLLESWMRGLVGAWLRDLAYHWKLASPPCWGQLVEAGLTPLLEGGIVRFEVTLGGYSLH